MAASGKGSIIYKIIIALLFVVMVYAIIIPGEIWDEEQRITAQSRTNMQALFTAEQYYHDKNDAFVPSDSLENLIAFIRNDSSLAQRREIGNLTNMLNEEINRILAIPTIAAMTPISRSVDELNGDLRYNSRFFSKVEYEQYDLMGLAGQVQQNLTKFERSTEFPNFNVIKVYVDSLNILSDEINNYRLQLSAVKALQYTDSLLVFMTAVEKEAVSSFWNGEYSRILQLINAIKQTDIVTQSSVADRLNKFIDRISSSLTTFTSADAATDVQSLSDYRSSLDAIHQKFISDESYQLTERNGIIQLNEIDSILVKFEEENFYCPDSYTEDQQRYLIGYTESSASLVVESPNLMPQLQRDLMEMTSSINDLPVFGHIERVRGALDSTMKAMNDVKDRYRLSRIDRSGELILDMKELEAEMAESQMDAIFLYRYAKRVEAFVDTVKSEQKLSSLKPLIEDVVAPMDTLAMRFETKNVQDLEEKLQYYSSKLTRLDSLMTVKVSARQRQNIPSFADSFQHVYTILDDMKRDFSSEDANNLRAASAAIFDRAGEVINGENERVYGVFSHKHINHGYITVAGKSWELEE